MLNKRLQSWTRCLLLIVAITSIAPHSALLANNTGVKHSGASDPTLDVHIAPTQLCDLLHTKLEVTLDWEQQQLHSVATIQLKPHFYPQQQVILDAHHFTIHQISLLSDEEQTEKAVQYAYDQQQLTIQLDRTYAREEVITLRIAYTTKGIDPKQKKHHDAERGIYFIAGDNEQHIPQQAWTQGEPHTSSYWFPTIDSPTQRLTQEIYVTVANHLKTLSNGTLMYAVLNEDDTRTDYWRLELPHAPYLFMLAVGDFAEVEDECNEVPISYYVPPKYEAYAKSIFKYTPAMLDFFSEKLDYAFPWPRYSQIIVRDYIAGAMENTTAVVFSEAVQGDDNTLLDKPDREHIIAHELFHHWFGNVITCYDWGQLAIQEAFAEWGAHLWYTHNYSPYDRDYLISKSIAEYLEEYKNKQVSVIRYHYQHPLDMFDRHTYSKGNLILHMLEAYIGHEAFVESLSQYLKKYAFSATDIHQLRRVFEEVSGQALNWFFDQWFLQPGHPILQVNHTYEKGKVVLKISQKQAGTPYQLPVAVDIWVKGKKKRHMITIQKAYQEFRFPTAEEPEVVYLDRNYLLAAEITHLQSNQAYRLLYDRAMDYWAKAAAIHHFNTRKHKNSVYYHFFKKVIKDPFWEFQVVAMQAFAGYKQVDKNYPSVAAIEKQIITVLDAPDPRVRAQALETLSSLPTAKKYIATYKAALVDPSYNVASKALYAYACHSTEAEDIKNKILTQFELCNNMPCIEALASYYIHTQQGDKYDWIYEKTTTLYKQWGYENLLASLAEYATSYGTAAQQSATLRFLQQIIDEGNMSFNMQQAVYHALQALPDSKEVKKLLNLVRDV